jgi:hypothetical protein
MGERLERWEFVIKDHKRGYDLAGHEMSEADLRNEAKVDKMLQKTKEYIQYGILQGKFDE